ncbi:MAG: glycosyltransferase family 2 protein [Myxococcota bacterium]|nr:glycosyltransferase family 2 protein [Myxococcota bacterium]MDP7298445.1 glycosyltransferase family 2 protein [Myxococcota bacterium]
MLGLKLGSRRVDVRLVKVDVCIASYRRPRGLQRLLGGLGQLCVGPDVDLRIVVVDNDPEETAREVCEAACDWLCHPLVYRTEKRRGIPQARNAALGVALGRADFVAFIDDDEVPAPDWLAELLRVQRVYAADAVRGPVLPVFESPAPAWLEPFFDRPRYATGQQLKTAYTHNVLVSTRALASLDRLFDERLGLTGADDSELFQRFAHRGHRIVWADEAPVLEFVPRSRLRLGWLLQRAFRVGNGSVFIDRHCRGLAPKRWQLVAQACWCIARGTAMQISFVWGGRPAATRGLQLVSFGTGRFAGLAGYRYEEYRRVHGA